MGLYFISSPNNNTQLYWLCISVNMRHSVLTTKLVTGKNLVLHKGLKLSLQLLPKQTEKVANINKSSAISVPGLTSV